MTSLLQFHTCISYVIYHDNIESTITVILMKPHHHSLFGFLRALQYNKRKEMNSKNQKRKCTVGIQFNFRYANLRGQDSFMLKYEKKVFLAA